MSEIKNNAETVDCSPAELRELQRYVQSLEKELHEKKRQLVHVRAARSIRIARAVSQLKKKPAEAASEIWNILRSPRDTG